MVIPLESAIDQVKRVSTMPHGGSLDLEVRVKLQDN